MWQQKRGSRTDYGKSAEERERQAEADSRKVTGATIVSVEAHARRSQMYKLALALEYEEQPEKGRDSDEFGDEDSPWGNAYTTEPDEEPAFASWSDEVDALIASAQTVAEPGEKLLTLHEDTLVGWRLLKGRRLTADEYERLLVEEQKEEAYRSALGMLERKARTSAELSRALKRKGYPPEAIAGSIARLQSHRMLDDSAFAKRYAEQKAANQRKGRMLIRQELMQRGVGRPDIEEALGELSPDVEQQAALALARKKWPTTKGNERERKQKLMAMLMRRGYTGSVVRNAVQQAVAEAGDNGRDDDAEWNEYDEQFD